MGCFINNDTCNLLLLPFVHHSCFTLIQKQACFLKLISHHSDNRSRVEFPRKCHVIAVAGIGNRMRITPLTYCKVEIPHNDIGDSGGCRCSLRERITK